MIGQLFQEIGTVFAPQSYSSTQEDTTFCRFRGDMRGWVEEISHHVGNPVILYFPGHRKRCKIFSSHSRDTEGILGLRAWARYEGDVS